MIKYLKWPFTWLIVFLCLSLIGLGFGFTRYQPEEAAADKYQQNADAANAIGDQLPQAQARVANAIKMIQAMNAQWSALVDQHSPATNLKQGGINIGENPFQLVADAPKFRNSVQEAVNHQMRIGGVKVMVGPYVTDPTQDSSQILASYFNYPAIPFPVVIFNLGQVQVQGTWAQIEKNYESWGTMPNYFAVSDGLQITGTSPYLTGTYSVSVVGYIKGKSLFPIVASADTSGTNGTSGAGGGPTAGSGSGAGGSNNRPRGPRASGVSGGAGA